MFEKTIVYNIGDENMAKKHRKTNMNELNNIRNEIIADQEQRRSVWINMYILYAALFAVGIQWSYYLFLVTYLIILPFQATINNLVWNVARLSAYIRIFYEEDDETLNWESMNANYEVYRKYLGKMESKLSAWIRNTSAAQLGGLSTMFFICMLIYNKYSVGMNILDILLILLSIVLFGVALKLSIDYKKRYKDELESITYQYKEYIKNKSNKI